jgi:hypothetical protein
MILVSSLRIGRRKAYLRGKEEMPLKWSHDLLCFNAHCLWCIDRFTHYCPVSVSLIISTKDKWE